MILLDAKRDDQQEYTIHLFEFCNLSCSFCWQDHVNLIGTDTVLEKLEPVEEFLKQETKSRVVFNIMGGEIFADSIYDEKLNNDYIQLAHGIFALGQKYNIETAVNWVTNLVTTKIDLIETLLDTIPSTLFTSYDPAGRFNKKDLKLFKKNLYHFKPHLDGIGLLLTKQNINAFLKSDPNLDQFYKDGFYLYADYYMPDKTAHHQAPTDHELFAVFKYFVDNYPKISPVAEWIERQTNYISCRSSKLVLEDNTMCMCGNLVQEPDDKAMYVNDIQPMDNTTIEESFVEKYGCLSCEYFNRCTLGCFMQHDYRYRQEMDECVYKETFKYIDMASGIIARA